MVYLRLIWMYYDTEQPILNEPAKLAFRLGSETDRIQIILENFFELSENRWIHKRCDAEIAKYHAKSDSARKANEKRWGSKGDLKSEAKQILTNNQEPIDKTIVSADADFENFWQAWPSSQRKVGKAKCLEIWKRRKLSAKSQIIVGHVLIMKATKQWLDGFDPAPLTYLNQSRWEDGVPVGGSGIASSGSPDWVQARKA
jgi:uncharacterized protein YdaU (DUF1376 family)